MTGILLVCCLAADLSADFWGRTIPLKDDQGNLVALASDDHIVVEVKVTVPRGRPVRVTASQFRLRVNGEKAGLVADSPGMAAAAVQYPDWSQRPRVEGQAGPVIIGRPAPVPRFPGDNSRRAGPYQESGPPVSERLERAAWPEGEVHSATTGLLFFPWRGKVAKIKKLELAWEGPSGEQLSVKLR